MPMSEAVLFKTCLGFNDSTSISNQIADPKSGKTQLTAVQNMTVTDDGAIKTAPALAPMLAHTNPITRLSAGQRLFFGDGFDIYEAFADGTSAVRFPICDGPMMHTPLDVRVSTTTKVYKSANPAGVMTEALVGTNPDPGESIAWAKMPLFDGGFVLGARAYAHKGRFLQYSKGYYYDLWDLADGQIGHQLEVLQAGPIPGCVLAAHAEGVSTYLGGDPMLPEAVKRFYPCLYQAGTLFSGFISKALGYGHVFLCGDGVYMVSADGAIVRLSGDNLEHAGDLNSSYAGAVVAGGKYLAYGDQVCIEYDFQTKAAMLRPAGVSAACVLGDAPYLAYGSTVSTLSSNMDTSTASSFTLPFSHLGAAGRKSFDSLYVTGEFNGDLDITLMDQDNPDEPERWTLPVSELGVVQNRRIKLPTGPVGSKVSFRFELTGGMRVEEIRCTFGAGQRR